MVQSFYKKDLKLVSYWNLIKLMLIVSDT